MDKEYTMGDKTIFFSRFAPVFDYITSLIYSHIKSNKP